MEFNRKKEADGRRRLSPLLWLASLGAIGVMVLGITGTLSQYVASITNSENHVETGGADSFGFSESNVVGGVPEDPACAEASAGQAVTCSTVNKNGQTGASATPIAPGQSRQRRCGSRTRPRWAASVARSPSHRSRARRSPR